MGFCWGRDNKRMELPVKVQPPPPPSLKAFAESGAAEAMSMPSLQHKLHAAWKRCQGQFWTRAVVRSHGSIYHVWSYRRILHIPLSLIAMKEENPLFINWLGCLINKHPCWDSVDRRNWFLITNFKP